MKRWIKLELILIAICLAFNGVAYSATAGYAEKVQHARLTPPPQGERYMDTCDGRATHYTATPDSRCLADYPGEFARSVIGIFSVAIFLMVNLIYTVRPFVTGGLTCLLIVLYVGSFVSTAFARPPHAKVATRKVTKTELQLELAAVEDFFKAIAETVKKDREASSKGYGFERGVWTLPRQWCVTHLGLPKNTALEDCIVSDISQRRAAVVTTVKNCEPEHCDADSWILSGRSGLRRSPITFEDTPVVSPDGKYLFTGYTSPNIRASGYRANLIRVSLATLKTETIAACAAPTLSPSERWVVCRDASGHVHRIPIQGGALQRVHSINLGKETIYIDAHLGVHLPPVTFIKKNRMRIVTLTADHREDVEEATWNDEP